MPVVKVPHASLYWKLDGRDDAPALILLNSIGTHIGLWDAALPYLREHFALLRIDTRGHGASTAEPGDYTLQLLAEDVLAAADAAGLSHFSVAGVSLGGMIGMELALNSPDRLHKLALICTSATMDPASWNDRIAKVRNEGMAAIADLAMGRFLSEAFLAGNPAVYEAVRRNLISMDAEGYAGCGAAIRDMDLSSRISNIACPTLVVTGSRDTSTPYEGHGDHLVTQIPGASHCPLGAAHLAPLEAPAALAGLLVSFLEG